MENSFRAISARHDDDFSRSDRRKVKTTGLHVLPACWRGARHSGLRGGSRSRRFRRTRRGQVSDAAIKSVRLRYAGRSHEDLGGRILKLNPNVKIDVVNQRFWNPLRQRFSAEPPNSGRCRAPMHSSEYEPFEKIFGYHPASLPVAVRSFALAVYVNKDNPIQCLTIEQLDQIFSKTHLFSGGKNVKTWGDLGLTGDWASDPVALFGRNSASGTHDMFVDAVLAHGEFKDELKEEPGSAEVVKMVAADKFRDRLFPACRLSHGRRPHSVPLAAAAGRQVPRHVAGSDLLWSVSAGAIPLHLSEQSARQPLDTARLWSSSKYIVSRDGQIGTVKSGFYPITNFDTAERSFHDRRFE